MIQYDSTRNNHSEDTAQSKASEMMEKVSILVKRGFLCSLSGLKRKQLNVALTEMQLLKYKATSLEEK